jgi:hypothetical protein
MIVAAFDTEADLMRAAARLRAAAVGDVETYTSAEPPEDVGAKRSPIPLVVLVAGLVGTIGMFLLQTYATTIGYPLDIGGRPDFSWPAYIPTAFEVGILFAILAGFVGFLAANRMPRLYDRIDESEVFRSAARGGFCLAIEKPESLRAHALLAELGPIAIEDLLE